MRLLVPGLALLGLLTAPTLACPKIPAVGAAIDGLLKQTDLHPVEQRKVEDLEAQIKTLTAAGKEADARKAEEEAMGILGFSKAWLKCGPGTFMWVKSEPKKAETTPPKS
jgi:hypothetical protein